MSPPIDDPAGQAPKRLEVTADELSDPAIDARIEKMHAARDQQLIRPVGDASAAVTDGSWWRGSAATMATAGVVGGLAGSLIAEVVSGGEQGWDALADSAIMGTILWFGVYALVLVLSLSAWDGLQTGGMAKAKHLASRALLPAAGAAIVASGLAQTVFGSWMESLYMRADFAARSEAEFFDIVSRGIHLPRGVAWGIAGAGLGLALGGASKSWQRGLNGAIGGGVGGFIGGYLFDYIGDAMPAATAFVPRVVGMTLMGLATGVAVGLVETARREHWLEIVSGGMAGKQFILYTPRVTVGTAPSCDITLIKDPAMATHHVTLEQNAGGLLVRSASPSHPVLVNGQSVSEHAATDGSLIQLGSTVVRYRAKQAGAGSSPVLR
jgi:hypothetical protein